MKKQTRQILIILLTLVAIATLVTVVACTSTVNVTVDFGLEGVDNITMEVRTDESLLFALESKRPLSSGFFFDGWYLEDGTKVTENTKVQQDVTVKARWLATYKVEYYLQNLDGDFALSATHTQTNLTAQLGSTVTAEAKTIEGYTLDENNVNNVKSATLNANGIVLKLYYKINTVTVSFDKGLLSSVTGEVEPKVALSGQTVTLPECGFEASNSRFEFAGWNTEKDGSGTNYSVGEKIKVTRDLVLYATWKTTFTEEIWIELDNGGYEQVTTLTRNGILGSTVSSTAKPSDVNTTKYVLDPDVSGSVNSGVVSEEGLKLVSYFSVRTFAVRYADTNMELGEPTYYKYGQTHVVLTPEQDPNAIILRYSTSRTGEGIAYEFGTEIVVTSDITFYPIVEDVYRNEAGGNDKLVVHRGMTGWGAATLTMNGKEYTCRVQTHETNGFYEFYAYLNETDEEPSIFGILLEDNLFRYRNNEEVGYFVRYDFFADDYYSTILFFDGYGFGGLKIPANDGTDRERTYWVDYTHVSGSEYEIVYYVPGETKYKGHVRLASNVPEGSGDVFSGSFVLRSEEGYFEGFYLYENGEIDTYVKISLDGYGYAALYDYDDVEGSYVLSLEGYYVYSQNYWDYGDFEYVFMTGDVSNMTQEFHFIWMLDGDDETGYLPMFMMRNEAMYGSFTPADGSDAELYLDGYMGAMFYSNDRDAGRRGYYLYSESDERLVVKIVFDDELGGTMTAVLNTQARTFTIASGGFIIENNVLVGYEGNDSVIVIPEGVVEIADNVFNGINITSVTFPESLAKIGNLAFSNGNVSGGSPLTTAIFLGTTPPVLGEDVFRWIKGSNFKIIVPDGYAEAYRTAETWAAATASQPDGYQKFVTTREEQANKPMYEIVDHVLISYNNNDDNPTNVVIDIPDDAWEIAPGVFAGLTYIVSVNLNNVKVIGANAFYGCTGLREVTFNPNTVSIGNRAFYECKLLASVDLGAVETIGEEAFSRCFGLKQVTMGSRISSIGSYAFYMCAQDVNADETEITMYDLVVTMSAITAPSMGSYVFQGSQPRVYVPNYEIGVGYAKETTWITYLKHLRVKASETFIYYSRENLGMTLELGDNIIFDSGSMLGLYKLVNNTLSVTWFNYDATSNTLVVITAQGTLNAQNEISGLKVDDYSSYVFVRQGEERTYRRNSLESLVITFGSTDAIFNNIHVQLTIGFNKTTFEYNGYTYTITLFGDYTFSYTQTKITVTTTYTAEDGSTLTIYDGTMIQANGRIKNVDGQGLEKWTETKGWYLTKVDDNVYWFRIDHLSYKYYVVVTLDRDNLTFTYSSSLGSSIVTYTSAEGHRAIVTKQADGTVTSIHILFKTANASLEAIATFEKLSDDVYEVVVYEKVIDYDENDLPYERDSEFNGTYTLTLNSDGTCTLVKK